MKKISNKIIILYSMLIMTLVVFLILLFNDFIVDALITARKGDMVERARFIENAISIPDTAGVRPDSNRLNDRVKSLSDGVGARITVIAHDGRVLADSDVDNPSEMENHMYRHEVRGALAEGSGTSIRYSSTLKTEMLYYAVKSGPWVIRMAKPLYEIEENLRRVRKLIVFSSIFIVITAFIIIIFISKKITGPINETLDFARDFSSGNYSRRILNYSEDEIGALQKSLNRLAETIVDKINSLIFEQNKLKITLESITEGIVVIGDDRKVLIANRAFGDFIDVDYDITGRLYFEAIRSRSLNSKIEYVLSTGLPASFEEKLINGRIFDVYINPIKELDTLQGILVVLRDITEKKKIEQIKTDLVGNMSHELKTPITIMKGYLETIQENLTDTALCRDYVDRAIENADRQNAIINDILKLNLIETARDVMEDEFNIHEMISSCLEILAPKASKKNITVSSSIESVNETVKSNRFLAEEVFFNLIDNAINYNRESGRITITAEKNGMARKIMIADTGIGIPEESIDRLFERFYRVDKSRSRATGGTGLGLSIVKHAVELLGWDVKVASGPDGSVFTIEIYENIL